MGFYGLPAIPLGLTTDAAAPTIPVVLSALYGPGQSSADYVVFMTDPTGRNILAVLDEYVELDYVLNENDKGIMMMEFAFDPTAPFVWAKDNRFYIYRRVPNGTGYYLEGNTAWLLSKYKISWPSLRIKINAVDLNGLLDRWTVPYNEGNSYTYKLDAAGDMALEIVDENMGSAALDTARSIESTYMTIPLLSGLGQTVRLQFTNDSVMAACQKIVEASEHYGTWVGFRIVMLDVVLGTFTFEIYVTTSADDRRLSSNDPLLFGPDYGTAELAEYEEDYTNEITTVYVAGQGDEFMRPLVSATDTLAAGLSPFRNEGFFSAGSEAPDATSLATVAQQRLEENRARKVLTLSPNDALSALYGVEWGLGTLVTGSAFGKTQDYRIDQVHVNYSGREKIDVRLRSI